jgi:hypothetical protein
LRSEVTLLITNLFERPAATVVLGIVPVRQRNERARINENVCHDADPAGGHSMSRAALSMRTADARDAPHG